MNQIQSHSLHSTVHILKIVQPTWTSAQIHMNRSDQIRNIAVFCFTIFVHRALDYSALIAFHFFFCIFFSFCLIFGSASFCVLSDEKFSTQLRLKYKTARVNVFIGIIQIQIHDRNQISSPKSGAFLFVLFSFIIVYRWKSPILFGT